MANKYGYMAKIGVDTSGLQKDLADVNSYISETSRSISATEKAIKAAGQNGQDATELWKNQQQLLNKAFEANYNKLEQMLSIENKMKEAILNHAIDTTQYAEYRNEISNTRAEMAKLVKMQKNLGDACDDTGEKVDDTGEKVSQFGDILKANLTAQAIEGAVRILERAASAMKDYALAGIQLASDLVEKQNVVDVTFGNSANKVYEFADAAAEKFGITRIAAMQYAGTMGALFKSSGITEGIDEMSISMAGLAADMASFYNISADDAFNKLKSGISGESEPLKALGINMNVANLEAYALSQGIDKAWKSMSQAEQTTLRYQYILSQTADAQGDFSHTSDSVANQQKIMQMNLQSVQAEIGEKLLPVTQEVLGMVNDHMPEINEAANYLADEMVPVIEDIADSVRDFIESGGLEKGVDAIKWVVDNGDKLIAILGALWGTEKITEFIDKFGGVTTILTGSIDGFGKLADTMTGPVSGAFKTFATNATTALTPVGESITGLGSTSALAFAGISAAAIAAVASLVAVSTELNTIADGMTRLSAETKKSDSNVSGMTERYQSLTEMSGLEQYKEASDMMSDILSDEEEWNERYKKTIDELNALQEKKFKTASQTARMKELQTQKESLDAEYASIELYKSKLNTMLDKYDARTVTSLERSAEAQRQAIENAGKTNEQAVSEAWEKIREVTKAKMEEYDSDLATHKIDDNTYWAQRKAYLEAHRDEDSEEWWKYYDAVNDHYDKLSKTEKTAADKSAKEAETALKDSYSKRYEALKRQQKENGYGDSWLADGLKKMLSELTEGSELYNTYYDKWIDLTDKISDATEKATEKEVKEWQTSSDKVSDAVEKKYEKVQQAFEKAKSSYINALDMSASDKPEDDIYSRMGLARPKSSEEEDTGNQYDFSSDTIEKQTKELDEYTRNMERLEKSDIPEEYLENIRSMNFDKRKEYVKELLKLSPERLKKHYADISKYYRSAEKAGRSDTQSLKDDADKAALAAKGSIQKSLSELGSDAYESGKAAAEAYWKGFKEYKADTDKLMGVTSAGSGGTSSSAAAVTPVNLTINVNGKQVATVNTEDYLNKMKNEGGVIDV